MSFFDYIYRHCGMEKRNGEFPAFRYSVLKIFVNPRRTDVKHSTVVIAAFFVNFQFFDAVKRISVLVFEEVFPNGLFCVFSVDYVFKFIVLGGAFKRSFRALNFYIVVTKCVYSFTLPKNCKFI